MEVYQRNYLTAKSPPICTNLTEWLLHAKVKVDEQVERLFGNKSHTQ